MHQSYGIWPQTKIPFHATHSPPKQAFNAVVQAYETWRDKCGPADRNDWLP